MDLYFQGMAWFNKGWTPEYVARARGLFDRALTADADNVEALIGSATADVVGVSDSFVTDPLAALAAAEAKLTKALSSVPDHALGHTWLGGAYIFTKRAAEGVAECEHALALDRNLAQAHASIGLGKIPIGRADETEAHIGEALRLSPRDTLAYTWMHIAGVAQNNLGSYEQAVAWLRRAIEANRNYPQPYFHLAAALAQLDRPDEARSAVKAAHAQPGILPSPAPGLYGRAVSDDPRHLARIEPVVEGMRKAGVPEMTAARPLAAILAIDVVGYFRFGELAAFLVGALPRRMEAFKVLICDGRNTSTPGGHLKDSVRLRLLEP